ncbi:RagB/SusD domain-containing protein [Gemmatirosa kalamazoonensis]|uniref:RagB/SusD domain-containing protein n=1 Tax=Gemmatirosa kalamazoonensis TaxID=861299 RepID=W0RH92_9BACT|nr:RagB/SusD family nutrient uptake outer membrane protein [Gemmatirosa kalamazoonensis]AHG89787.1 RagB/SusD domain-containing protein [Gemmatirosa kalamazoonensis]
MNRKKQRVVLFTALTVLSAAGVYGCKDFLSAASSPQGTLNAATLTNKTGVEGSLIAAYRTLDCTNSDNGNWGCAASNWVWGSVTSDDAYKGSEASDQPEVTDIELYHWGTANSESYLNVKWRAMYEGVNRANATIRLLKDVQKSNPSALPAAEAKSVEGEALFLRAHYHFEAWEMWGSIPYYRETDTDFRKPAEASDAVIADILKDLDAAIALLPATPWNGQVGRATSWTAKAYKGRVQVYAGQYAAGLATLRDVRASGPYALESSLDRVWTGFKQYENGKETILAFQASVNDGEGDAANSNYGERLNFPHSGSHFGCCGFHQPSQTLVNHYRVDANGLPLALSDPNGYNNADATFTAAVSKNVAVDPRLDWTVGRDGVPYKDWGPHDPSWIRAPGYGGPYSPKKNVHEKASGSEASVGWAPAQQNGVNIHIYRYADLLLLLAEAEVEAGSLENARAIVNQIRQRAAAGVQGPGTDASTISVPINDSRITWAKYQVGQYTAPWTNQQQARDAVREERNLELAMEGHRFFDLRRWKIADQVMNAYLAKEKTRRTYLAAAEPVAARHQLYPIPNIQIQLSKVNGAETLKQNPGW